MPMYANQYNSSFLSCEKLKEISIVLKKGRTTQSRVMNFILTMFECILMNADHRIYLNQYKNVFSKKSIKILRDDLKNLLQFNTKFFDTLFLELLLEALRKEKNYCNRCSRLNLDENGIDKRWNKMVLRRRIKAIVKFLIFRKVKTSSYFHDENNITDWSSYKQKIGFILNNEISPSQYYIMYENVSNRNERMKDNYERNLAAYIYCKMKNERTNDAKSSISYSTFEPNFYEVSKYTCIGYVYSKIYSLVRYGCLWIFCFLLLRVFLPNIIKCYT